MMFKTKFGRSVGVAEQSTMTKIERLLEADHSAFAQPLPRDLLATAR